MVEPSVLGMKALQLGTVDGQSRHRSAIEDQSSINLYRYKKAEWLLFLKKLMDSKRMGASAKKLKVSCA